MKRFYILILFAFTADTLAMVGFEAGRNNLQHSIVIDLANNPNIHIRHGAAIDGLYYNNALGQKISLGGTGGTSNQLPIQALKKLVIYEGDYRWGGRHIVKIIAHYQNGLVLSYGSVNYADNIKEYTHFIKDNVKSIEVSSEGRFIDGLKVNYANIDENTSNNKSFEFLDIKKVSSSYTGEDFLYTVMPYTNKIGLLTYNRQSMLNVSINQLNYERLEILECGPSDQFTAQPGVFNHEDELGFSGYESTDDFCHIARNNEFKWLDGTHLGVSTWYSTSLNGDIQCYSTNGRNCLWFPDYSNKLSINTTHLINELRNNSQGLAQYLDTYNEVYIRITNNDWLQKVVLPDSVSFGKRMSVDVDSTRSVNVYLPTGESTTVVNGQFYSWIYVGGKWIQEGKNINDNVEFVQHAEPLTCGEQHRGLYSSTGYDEAGHWCQTLAQPNVSHSKKTLQAMIDSKLIHIDRLFSQMQHYQIQKLEQDNRFTSRINILQARVNAKKPLQKASCAFAWWNVPALITCSIITKELNSLTKELNALTKEKADKHSAVNINIERGRNTQWHQLHKLWAQDDDSHFSALIKEESTTLDELIKNKAAYEKDAQQAYADYQQAIQQYMRDTNPANLFITSLEDLPIVGPEIKHIVDYAEHRTAKNLRKMLLGIAGPVGESIEGDIELLTGESGLDSGSIKFLAHVLGDLSDDDSIGEALEDIVSDAINDLGDEVVESLRQADLWRDNPLEDNFIKSDYRNLVDFRSQMERIEYDFWNGSSEQEINVQNALTPTDFNYVNYIRNPLSYSPTSLIDMEYASGGSAFENKLAAIFSHAFGQNYSQLMTQQAAFSNWKQSQINFELYKVLTSPAYFESRIPYWVDSSMIGQRPAGFIYDDNHAFIVINRDLVAESDADFQKFYFEELGHMLNWWRCKIFGVSVNLCQVAGDAGARFKDAVLIDQSQHVGGFESLLAELPQHGEVDINTIKFTDDSFATLEGWPSYYTINDHIAAGGSFSWLMRLGLDVTSGEFKFVSDEFDLEVSITAPKAAMKGNPWDKSANGYCKTDTDTDCNMPTMWVSVSFRDALKLSVAKLPQIKDSQFAQVGFDLSPRIVRKHGGKLPFQLSSVNGTDWSYKGDYSIYAKKFTAGLEAKLDLWKMGHAISKNTASKIHKPELSLKTTPASGSYLVEIATRDKADFAGWLAGDIASAVSGCAAGFAIGVVAEVDPVVLCHGFSYLTETVESAFQGLDKKPTMLFEADANVTLPVSLEYKYATSGEKLTRRASSTAASGRATYNADTDTAVSTISQPSNVTAVNNPQITSFKNKASRAFSKLSKSSISPVAVFRFRVGFGYGEKIIQKGEYALPAAIVED
ncbi:beta-prism lectin domain-containing protein [Shewanella gaetbuli]